MSDVKPSYEQTHVGIVGGGLCGCATAYFLRQLMGPAVAITLFEKTDQLGGRVRSQRIGDDVFELGGSIFTRDNRYMSSLTDAFGLQKKIHYVDDSPLLIYGGHQKVSFSTLQKSWLVAKISFLWRYGLDLFKFHRHVSQLADSFAKIYAIQASGRCFETPAALLTALSPDFVTMTGVTFGSWLENRMGLRKRFCNEVAHAFVASNYCQDLNVHAFVGMVSGAGSLSTLHSVVGGNNQVAKHLLDSALAENPPDAPSSVVFAEVKSLSDGKQRRYCLEYCSNDDKKVRSAEFDYVVLACPLHQEATISAPQDILPARSEYRVMHKCIHSGRLNYTKLGLPAELPNKAVEGLDIMLAKSALEDPETLFQSMGSVKPEKKTTKIDSIWATFTVPERMVNPAEQLSRTYFAKSQLLNCTRWLAYPKYAPLKNPSVDLGTFVLAPGLIYASALELAASCMEVAVISGRNAALLISTRSSKMNPSEDV
uniref:Prenylcysteine oxidase n=1 Tax=Schistocephalus solidus TaxID=70667 RepID=A0A0X3NT34_SCHSO